MEPAPLRARIDMTSPEHLARDPVLYRIRHAEHHRTGRAWCVYPMYDFCPLLERLRLRESPIPSAPWSSSPPPALRLDFEPCRAAATTAAPDRIPAQPRLHRDEQTEAAPTGERRTVSGWNDPRMPTLSGLRRRGIPARSIRGFCTAHRRDQVQRRLRPRFAGTCRPGGLKPDSDPSSRGLATTQTGSDQSRPR